MANLNCIDWRFQIHWNKIERVNPRSRIEGKNPFCVYTKKFYLKYDDKPSRWVGHSKLNTLDLEDFYRRKRIINKIEDSLTETKIKQSHYGMKIIHIFIGR